jgi:hypothetical protein
MVVAEARQEAVRWWSRGRVRPRLAWSRQGGATLGELRSGHVGHIGWEEGQQAGRARPLTAPVGRAGGTKGLGTSSDRRPW